MLPPVKTASSNSSPGHTKVIKPINDINAQSDDLKKLIAEAEAEDTQAASIPSVAPPVVPAMPTVTTEPVIAPPVVPAMPTATAAPVQIPVIVPPVTPPTPQA